MGDRVTLEDIAKRAGVSKATVSAVINDKPVVRKSTRQRVLNAIEELGYRSQGIDLSLQGRKQKSIGLVIKEGDNPFYAEVAYGARAYAREKGYVVVMASSEGDYEEERELVALLKEQGCLGLILSPILDERSDLSYLFVLQQSAYPMVVLEEVRGLQTDLVTVDNVGATKNATKFYIDQGHTNIVHFSGPAYSLPSLRRAEGFRMAFSESYLKFEPRLVIPTGAHMIDGYRTALAYFGEKSREERPTAVICFNDQVAIGVYRALRELGIIVPDEVAITGCDNIDVLEYFPAPISTVEAHTRQMGRTAAELLIRRIEAKKPLMPQRISMETTLVVRPPLVGVEAEAVALGHDGT